jgi:glycosyltransferase involved in cell wall biosynthesis
MKPNIIAVIPALNEEKTIGKIVKKTRQHVDDVVVVDDGSWDHTAEIAEAMGAEILSHPERMGYGAAIRDGLRHALQKGADRIVTLDADDQHDPDEIPLLVDGLLEKGTDIAIGSRFLVNDGAGPSRIRKLGIDMITRLTTSKGNKITDAQSGFRAYRSAVVKDLDLEENGMGASTEIILKASKKGYKMSEIPVHIVYTDEDSLPTMVAQGLDVYMTTVKLLMLSVF